MLRIMFDESSQVSSVPRTIKAKHVTWSLVEIQIGVVCSAQLRTEAKQKPQRGAHMAEIQLEESERDLAAFN